MIRDGVAIGTSASARAAPARSTDKQVGCCETFADQAVIAIENVRLFDETQGSAGAADGDGRDAAA